MIKIQIIFISSKIFINKKKKLIFFKNKFIRFILISEMIKTEKFKNKKIFLLLINLWLNILTFICIFYLFIFFLIIKINKQKLPIKN
jgi:hypothetical protein